MKANELRIGNYYENNGTRQIEPSDIEMCHRNNKSFNQRNKPIELSEQWLKDLGLKKERPIDVAYIIKCGEYTLSVVRNGFSDDKWWVSIKLAYGSHSVTVVKQYVHQLQNLFFELTKTELTKQLKP